jgi:hypothetical protein
VTMTAIENPYGYRQSSPVAEPPPYSPDIDRFALVLALWCLTAARQGVNSYGIPNSRDSLIPAAAARSCSVRTFPWWITRPAFRPSSNSSCGTMRVGWCSAMPHAKCLGCGRAAIAALSTPKASCRRSVSRIHEDLVRMPRYARPRYSPPGGSHSLLGHAPCAWTLSVTGIIMTIVKGRFVGIVNCRHTLAQEIVFVDEQPRRVRFSALSAVLRSE